MKLKIDKISKQVKESPKTNPKTGEKYKYISVGIQSGGIWYNGLASVEKDFTESWSEGMEVEVEIEEKEVGGKVYKNFKPANPINMLMERVEKLEASVRELQGAKSELSFKREPIDSETAIASSKTLLAPQKGKQTPETDTKVDIDDLPF